MSWLMKFSDKAVVRYIHSLFLEIWPVDVMEIEYRLSISAVSM